MARYRSGGGQDLTSSGTELFDLLLRWQELKRRGQREEKLLSLQSAEFESGKKKTEAETNLLTLNHEINKHEFEFRKELEPLTRQRAKLEVDDLSLGLEAKRADIRYRNGLSDLNDVDIQRKLAEVDDLIIGKYEATLGQIAGDFGVASARAEQRTVSSRAEFLNSAIDLPVMELYNTPNGQSYRPRTLTDKEAQDFPSKRKFRDPAFEQMRKQYGNVDAVGFADMVRTKATEELDKLTSEGRAKLLDDYKIDLTTEEGQAAFLKLKVLDPMASSVKGQMSANRKGDSLELTPARIAASGWARGIFTSASAQVDYRASITGAEETLKEHQYLLKMKMGLPLKAAQIQADPKLTPQQRTVQINQFLVDACASEEAPDGLRSMTAGYLVNENLKDEEEAHLRGVTRENIDFVLRKGDLAGQAKISAFGGVVPGMIAGGPIPQIKTNRQAIAEAMAAKAAMAGNMSIRNFGSTFTPEERAQIAEQQALENQRKKEAEERWMNSPVGL